MFFSNTSCQILSKLQSGTVVTKQKFTEWEITKTEVGNEMEIFI